MTTSLRSAILSILPSSARRSETTNGSTSRAAASSSVTPSATNPVRPPQPGCQPLRFLRAPVQIIRADLAPYIALNVLMYRLLLAGMAAGMLFTDLHAARLTSTGRSTWSCRCPNAWLFAATILAVNTLTVGLASILVPSMIVPFAGILICAYRAFTGLTLAPADETSAITPIPHLLTLALEFQAYILLVLSSYLLGKSWLRPRNIDAQNRRRGYVLGLRRMGWLSLPALALLIVGAIYEAFSLIYLVPRLIAG